MLDPSERAVESLIDQKREQPAQLCRQYGVKRLAVFGSALRADFDSEHSDLDFLVEFQPLPPGGYADTYFGLLEDLERLFGRRVDLVVESAIKNPYFRESVTRSQALLYAA
jgi:predicted nucleotidyltransferase